MIREHERDETGAVASRLDVGSLSRLDVNQFYGIEIGEFPARIAEVALWMMDHLMNNELSLEFGQSYARIPLKQSPHIRCADALEMDWEDLLPAEDCSFVFGNPPFGGAKFQSPEQRAQVRLIAALGGSGGTLDYVTAWFITAGEYIRKSGPPAQRARIGFVATNSITQGEQVAQLWPILFGRCGLEIAYAHRTFAWGSDARGMAHVHVVIIGLDDREGVPAVRRLFSYEDVKGDPHESAHGVLSPYLFDAGGLADPHLVVREESRPINGIAATDHRDPSPSTGDTYIFSADERSRSAFRKRNGCRCTVSCGRSSGVANTCKVASDWILALHDAPRQTLLAKLPLVHRRVWLPSRQMRSAGRSKSNRRRSLAIQADDLFHVNVVPDVSFPRHSRGKFGTSRMEYAPIGWLEPPVNPEQSSLRPGKCLPGGLRSPDLRYAHGVAAARRWTAEE